MKGSKLFLVLLIVLILGLVTTIAYSVKKINTLDSEVNSYLKKETQLANLKADIKDFYKEKLFEKINNFRKKVPLEETLAPLRAMRELGIIIKEEGARGQVLYGIEGKTKDAAKNSNQTQQTQKKEEKIVEIGKEKIEIVPFQVELKADYDVLLDVFERVSNADILMMVYHLRLERSSSSSQFLDTEITLAGFLSQSKKSKQLKSQKSEMNSFPPSSSYPRR